MRNILLVEDDETHSELIRRSFEPESASRITWARTIAEARSRLKQGPADLVIADLRLPDGRGTDLISRSPSGAVETPVLIMTSHGTEQAAVEALKAGAVDYLVKSDRTLLSMPEFARKAFREWSHLVAQRRTEEELREYRENLERLVDQRTAELVEARREAERQNAAKTRFLAAASHDLRQPLQAANLLVYLLEKETPAAGPHEILEKLRFTLKSLGDLLNSLLDYSRVYSGVILPESRSFPVQVLFDRLENELQPLAREKGIQFRIRPTLAQAYSDPNLLDQSLRNLAYNALKYTHHGGILIACRFRGTSLLIQVWDTGPGIAADHLERIFEEFYQGEPLARDHNRGLGLGLAIARRLCSLLGSDLTVRSRRGTGSVFEIRVPRKPDTGSLPVPGQTVPEAGAPRPLRILVIEDEPELLGLLQSLLKTWGHSTIGATSAGSALEQTLDREIDLVITDFFLGPGETGADVLEEIRKRKGDGVRAIFLTGETTPENVRIMSRINARLLFKPINPDQLRQAIQTL